MSLQQASHTVDADNGHALAKNGKTTDWEDHVMTPVELMQMHCLSWESISRVANLRVELPEHLYLHFQELDLSKSAEHVK